MNILQKINQYVYQSRARKYLEGTERERRFVSYGKARSVLILFESDFSEKNIHIRRLISSLQQDGKKVTAWGFVNKKEIMTSIMPDFRILHHKQTDFFQSPVLSYLNELENMEFDLLLDLTLKPVLPLQYFALHAKALFKAGIHTGSVPVYDFLMDIRNVQQSPESDPESVVEVNEIYLYEQIIFYLKSIQTND